MATQFPERVHIHTSSGGGDGVFGYIVVGLLILAIIVFVVVVAVRVSKMRREEALKKSGQFPAFPPQQGFAPPGPPPPLQGFAQQGYAPPSPQQGFPQQPGYPPAPQQYAPPGPSFPQQQLPGPGAGPQSW